MTDVNAPTVATRDTAGSGNGSHPGGTAIRRAGILYQVKRPQVMELGQAVEAYLRSLGVETVRGAVATEDELLCQQLDLFITIGGDGTILRAARCAAQWNTPLFGINMGRLGFLTECGPSDWQPTLRGVVGGNWWLETRHMLAASLDDVLLPELALNEVVLGRGAHPRAIQVALSINGKLVGEMVADGIVVATPTGSTAYALAAGGPVLDPHLDALVLVAVAPHVSTPGPLVLPVSAHVSLTCTRDVDTVLSIDGQVDRPVKRGQTVAIYDAGTTCRFARTRPPETFYETLVDRLRRK